MDVRPPAQGGTLAERKSAEIGTACSPGVGYVDGNGNRRYGMYPITPTPAERATSIA